MKGFNYKIVLCFFFVAGLALVSCNKEDEGIEPSELSNLQAFEREGAIKLTWSVNSPERLEYVKITYFDKRKKKEMVRLASSHTDSIIIPSTRAKFGDYQFKLQPFSKTNTGGEVYGIIGRSGAAPADTTYTEQKISLTKEMLSTNAPEPREGKLEYLLDNNTGTFFHSAWSVSSPAIHNLEVSLPESIKRVVRFTYTTRANGGTLPRDIVLYGSNDGTTWNELTTLTSLISGSAVTYSSPKIWLDQSYKHFRFDVNSKSSGSKFFVMSEFSIWEVTPNIIDPEDPNVDI